MKRMFLFCAGLCRWLAAAGGSAEPADKAARLWTDRVIPLPKEMRVQGSLTMPAREIALECAMPEANIQHENGIFLTAYRLKTLRAVTKNKHH